MIKVLMLGWEFPPNISGGLGIACEGLATALVETKEVQILFVIPNSPTLTDNNDLSVLGANTIEVPTYTYESVGTIMSSNGEPTTSLSKEVFTVEKVDAVLSPYESPGEIGGEEFLEKWKMLFSQPNGSELHTNTSNRKQTGTTRHNFEGGYGNKLLQEVDKYAEVIVKLARDHEFDIIHAHDWMTFPAAVAVKMATGKPLVIHIHATEFDRAGLTGSNVVYDIERMAMAVCDRAIAVSKFTKKMLVERYGVSAKKIGVAYNGVDLKAPTIASATHVLGEQLVTFIGRITFQKGPEYFVDAAEKVLKEFPDCHFVMAGSGDALPDMIKRVIRKRMSHRFHFTGFLNRADVMRLMSFTRVYVMPSVSEPFGLTALEAINAGVPTVISKQSGVAEVMPDMIKVDFWDTDALAHAISGILRYPTVAETMRHNAISKVHHISWNLAAKNVLAVYRELMHAEHHSPSTP